MPTDTPQPPEFLRIGAAAKRLGVHVDTVRAWCDSGKLPFSRTPGGQRRVTTAAVDALMAEVEPEKIEAAS